MFIEGDCLGIMSFEGLKVLEAGVAADRSFFEGFCFGVFLFILVLDDSPS